MIAASKLKDLLLVYIDDHINLDHTMIKCIKKFVLKIFAQVDDGQFFESEYNTYKFFKNEEDLSPKKSG